MLEIFQRLFDTGNLEAGSGVIGSFTELDHMSIFTGSPRLYAAIVKVLHLKPLRRLQSIVPHIPLDLPEEQRIRQVILYPSSHIEELLGEFLELSAPHPIELDNLVMITPLDFQHARSNHSLSCNPPLYYTFEDVSCHASFLCGKVFEAAYYLKFDGFFQAEQFQQMIPEIQTNFRDSLSYCERTVINGEKLLSGKEAEFLSESFAKMGSLICDWSVCPTKKAFYDPLEMVLLNLEQEPMGDLALSQMSVRELVIRTIIVLIESSSIISVEEWTILLGLLSRCLISGPPDTEAYRTHNIQEYKLHLLELIEICLKDSQEWSLYIKKLENELYVL